MTIAEIVKKHTKITPYGPEYKVWAVFDHQSFIMRTVESKAEARWLCRQLAIALKRFRESR